MTEETAQATEETVEPAETDADATRAKIAAQGTEAEEAPTAEEEIEAVAAEETPTEEPPVEIEEPVEPVRKKTSGYSRLKARNQATLAENASLRAEMEALKSQDEADPEPKLEDFGDDYDAHQRALTAYDTRKVVREERSKEKAEDIESRKQETMQLAQDEFLERIDDARTKFTDYDTTIQSLQSTVGEMNPDLVGLLQDSDKGELILYHLGKNPLKGARLNQMGILEAAREVGKLEATLSVPKPKTETKAPPPVKPPSGGSAPPLTDLAKVAASGNMKEYVRSRQAK